MTNDPGSVEPSGPTPAVTVDGDDHDATVRSVTSVQAEHAEALTVSSLLRAAAPDFRAAAGVRVTHGDDGVTTTSIAAPSSGFWNRVLGLGIAEPITGERVDAAIATLFEHDAPDAMIQVVRGRHPGDWSGLVSRYGLRHTSSWVKLGCRIDELTPRHADVRVARVTGETTPEAIAVLHAAFGWPRAELDAIVAPAVLSGVLLGFAALDGATIIGVGNLYVAGEVGHMFGAGTLPEHRGRGAHNALLAVRATAARDLGCTSLIFETGADRPGEAPNPSLRNARAAGFQILHTRDNWAWSRTSSPSVADAAGRRRSGSLTRPS